MIRICEDRLKTDKRVKNGVAFATLLRHKRPTPRVDVTVMTRTRIYEKYHNVGWRNKKLALYQIPLSSSTAADRRSCTVARGPLADARSSIVTRCKRRQKCARLNFSRMNHRFRGTHWRWPPFCTPFAASEAPALWDRSASIRGELSIYDPSRWDVRTSYITFCLISIHVRDRFAITDVYMNPRN